MQTKNLISIPYIIYTIRKEKRIILRSMLIGGLLGILLALNTTKKYKAEAKLVPEMSSNGFSGQAGALASMVGLNLNLNASNDAISPQLYPQVLSTKTFLLELFDVPVTTKDKSVKTTYADYLLNHRKRSILGSLLPHGDTVNIGKVNPYELTKKQDKLVKSIGKKILCAVDDQTDVITINVTDEDPLVATIITDTVIDHIQKYIINYRTAKAQVDLIQVTKLLEKAKKDYNKAQKEYALYSDTHKSLIFESYKSELEELENMVQVNYNIYSHYLQQVELYRAKLQERTPVYAVIQPATVPIRPSGIGRSLIVLGCIFIGFCFALVWVMYLRNYLSTIKTYIPEEEKEIQ